MSLFWGCLIFLGGGCFGRFRVRWSPKGLTSPHASLVSYISSFGGGLFCSGKEMLVCILEGFLLVFGWSLILVLCSIQDNNFGVFFRFMLCCWVIVCNIPAQKTSFQSFSVHFFLLFSFLSKNAFSTTSSNKLAAFSLFSHGSCFFWFQHLCFFLSKHLPNTSPFEAQLAFMLVLKCYLYSCLLFVLYAKHHCLVQLKVCTKTVFLNNLALSKASEVSI